VEVDVDVEKMCARQYEWCEWESWQNEWKSRIIQEAINKTDEQRKWKNLNNEENYKRLRTKRSTHKKYLESLWD
jgi:hypothetical protein